VTTGPDPLADPRHARLLADLRAMPAPEPSPGFADRVVQARDHGRLLADLRAMPAPEPSSGFTDRVMRRIASYSPPRNSIVWPALRVAAALALLLAAGRFVLFRSAPPDAAPDPVAILMSAQRADGGWSAEADSARPRYDAGMTALALLALLEAGEPADPAGRDAAIRAGVNHLLRQQGVDGRIGGEAAGREFTHYLGAMALRAAARRSDADPAWAAAARRAEAHLPSPVQMASLNRHFARPDAFPERWADVGGPAAHAALQMLKR